MRLIDKTGDTSVYMNHDELTGAIEIVHEQDVTAFLDRMARMRQDSNERWSKGVKDEWMHYCSIPTVVIMELKQKGIDVFNPNDEKKMLAEINKNYKYLKTVDHKNHE